MSFVAVFMAFFSMLGVIDQILGNRFGLGKEFERGFMLLGNMALSMIGMIVLAPVLGEVMKPGLRVLYDALHIDPSVVPAMLFANDMGGAPLAFAVAMDEQLGLFNGLVVSTMMGCTISFTIPVAMDIVHQSLHKQMLSGLLCGIVTIPLGCFAAGMMLGIRLDALLLNLAPLIVFSALIVCGLVFAPGLCVRIFGVFGQLIRILIVVGLGLGVLRFLTGVELIKGLETYENGALICFNAAAVISGAFPFLFLLSKLIDRPVKALGRKIGISDTAAFGLIGSMATSMTTFPRMKDMDKKGMVLNAAFAVSGAFTFAGHLAFTLSYDAAYVPAVIVGKLLGGVSAIALALLLYKRLEKV